MTVKFYKYKLLTSTKKKNRHNVKKYGVMSFTGNFVYKVHNYSINDKKNLIQYVEQKTFKFEF